MTTSKSKKEVRKEERVNVNPTYSISYKMGFKQEWERGEVDYWYSPETYIKMKEIDILRENPKSHYFNLGSQSVPLYVDKETHEVTINYGVLNIMI